ncbi:MAG: multiheme c-type cytochrome [Pseudomonadota bacterium]
MNYADVQYVGSNTCAECHADVYSAWSGSHHFHAMQSADPGQVMARVGVDGQVSPDYRFTERNGELWLTSTVAEADPANRDPTSESSWRVPYVFGVTPLQQYLVDVGQGRLQAFAQAYPDPAAAADQMQMPARSLVIPREHFSVHGEISGPNDVLHWRKPGQNWNHMCADCHSTAVSKGYDPNTDAYATSFAEISVGCEACHGGGSAHVDWARSGAAAAAGADTSVRVTTLRSPDEQLNTCAQCHSRRGQLAEGFTPQTALLDHYQPALLDDGLYHADGQINDEVFVYGSFLQSKMHARGVTCSHCHEPHSARLRLPGNGTCTQCHSAAGHPDFPTPQQTDYDTATHHHHAQGSAGAQCVNCHMPAKVYMQVDARRDHSFRVPRPDLSAQLGTPNACRECHTDRSDLWLAERISVWSGKLPEPHFAPVLAAGRLAEPAAEAALAELALDPALSGIVRGTLMSLLSEYQRHGSSMALQQGLRDADPLVRIGALRGAQRWPPPTRFRALRSLLHDDLLAVRMAAVQALLPVFGELSVSQQAQLEPVLEEYKHMLQVSQDRAEGQTQLAVLYTAQGELEAAENAYQKAITLNPQWLPAYVNLADLYRDSQRDLQAGPVLDQALAVDPAQPNVLLAKAMWLVRRKQSDEAMPLLRRAYELAPQTPQYAYVYAVALHSNAQSAVALAMLEDVLQRQQGNTQLFNLALSIARDSGDMAAVARLLAAPDAGPTPR